MKALFDTSVWVAGMLRTHEHHQRASDWMRQIRARQVEMVVAAHTLPEVYSVLTRMPQPARVLPAEALRFIERDIFRSAEVVALDSDEYKGLIRHLACLQLAGGVTYDAVIACAAAKANVDHIVTFNYRDFARIYPALTASIIVP